MQLIYSLAICAVVVGGTSAYARDFEEENCTTIPSKNLLR